MSEPFEVTLTRGTGFGFDVDFHDGRGPSLHMDEPAPLGDGSGPNAARVLASAIGNCLSASLLFCFERARVPVNGIRTHVRGEFVRNHAGRLRLGTVHVRIEPELVDAEPARLDRCLGLFEDFCVVTQSARDGLDVEVEVAARAAEGGGPRPGPTVRDPVAATVASR